MTSAVSIFADHIVIAVRATPRARRSAVAGEVDTADGARAWAVRLAAPPVDGAANAELTRLLAALFGVRKGAVTIRSGEASRLKIVRIEGDGAELGAVASSIVAG